MLVILSHSTITEKSAAFSAGLELGNSGSPRRLATNSATVSHKIIIVQNNGRIDQKVIRRIGLAYGVMDSLNKSIWRCRYLCRRTKLRIFKTLVLPVLLYSCETWTLNSDLESRLSVFGTKCLRRIMGYRWNDFVSNQRLLHEIESGPFTSIVREHQLRLYAHVARLPDVDPANRVLSVRDNPGSRRPKGRPRNSWLGKVDRSCRQLLGLGRMGAWGLAWRDRPGWRRRVSDGTRSPAYASH